MVGVAAVVEKVSIDLSNGRFTVSDICQPSLRCPGSLQQTEGSITWGPPPTGAASGDTWTGTLSAAATCSGGHFVPEESSGYDWAGMFQVGVHVQADYNGVDHAWNAGTTCKDQAESTQLSWAFPVPDPGLLHLYVTLEASVDLLHDSWTYTYTWQP
jgi:hypothetical protein